MNSFSCETLLFHLSDSRPDRCISSFSISDPTPIEFTIQLDVKKVRHETMEALTASYLFGTAVDEGIEKERKVRVDRVVTEMNIHHLTDRLVAFMGQCASVLPSNLANEV